MLSRMIKANIKQYSKTVRSSDQISQLLSAKRLPSLDLPISVTIAWTRQFSCGKLYARELQEKSLDDFLDIPRPRNVVAVRKLLADPTKSSIPLFVLTFLGALPSSLKLGYVNYQLEKYIPKLLQCRKCWRLRHSTQHCRSKQTCSLCASTEHDRSSCTAPGPTCISCRGANEATSTTCPLLIYEQKVCAYQSDTKVSYTEARRQLPPPTIRNHPTAHEQPYKSNYSIEHHNHRFPIAADLTLTSQQKHLCKRMRKTLTTWPLTYSIQLLSLS